MLDNLMLGLQTAFTLHNLLFAFLGVLLGNIIGVLPGIGALAAISMLLPVTYGLDPTAALMMLAGLYYGTSFGGATTSILLNLPGTAGHAVVCLDGNPLARQGRGGAAIFMAMFSSSIGVFVGIILMMFISPLLTNATFLFGPAEYFAMILMGLLAASTLGSGSPLKGVASVLLGLVCGLVGTDVNSGVMRFTFGVPELQDGLSLVALSMGFFGVVDVLMNAGQLKQGTLITKSALASKSIRPAKGEIRQCVPAIARGSAIGSFLGILPGTGGVLASFMSYALEKKSAKKPERFGRGAIEGVAGPEAANSSGAITAFIPTLTLGIPGDPVMALMLGALMIHNILPGPLFIAEHPSMFWGLLVSFWIGNVLLLLLNIPLIGLWTRLLSIPYRYIYPSVLFLICIGVYSANNNLFDVAVVLATGVAGYFLTLLGFQAAPFLLGFVLGPMFEENFRRALLLSHGDLTVFISRPISGGFITLTLLILLVVGVRHLRRRYA